MERIDNNFKVGTLSVLQKRQDHIGKTVDDNDDDETCFDAVVEWLRSQSKEAKLTAVLLNVLLSHEHILPGKDIGNVLYREFEAESLAPNQGSLDFIVAYTAGMMAIPC